ncbi:MAG: hypothetical protein AAGF97_03920 [Planctomycetota bacterium]
MRNPTGIAWAVGRGHFGWSVFTLDDGNEARVPAEDAGVGPSMSTTVGACAIEMVTLLQNLKAVAGPLNLIGGLCMHRSEVGEQEDQDRNDHRATMEVARALTSAAD